MSTKESPHDHVIQIALSQMTLWFSELYGTKKVNWAINVGQLLSGRFVESKNPTIQGKLWTFTNKFNITAAFHFYEKPSVFYVNQSVQSIIDDGYLGAQATSRKSRTGEDWHRGNDLADGKFNEDTWIKIVKSMLAYEIEDIKSEAWKDPK